jgi:hypothetical protein
MVKIEVDFTKVKAFFASAWDWIKRVFGRSRTIALNVFGVLSIVWVELADTISGVNFDDFFKHELAMMIGIVVQVLNVFVRIVTTKPVNFGTLPPLASAVADTEPGPAPDAIVAPEPPTPPAMV